VNELALVSESAVAKQEVFTNNSGFLLLQEAVDEFVFICL